MAIAPNKSLHVILGTISEVPQYHFEDADPKRIPGIWKRENSLKSRSDRTPLKTSFGERPSLFSMKVFSRSAAIFSANGHSMFVTMSGQCLLACKSIVLAIKVISCILLSTTPFWWWAPTAQKVSLIVASLQNLRKLYQRIDHCRFVFLQPCVHASPCVVRMPPVGSKFTWSWGLAWDGHTCDLKNDPRKSVRPKSACLSSVR